MVRSLSNPLLLIKRRCLCPIQEDSKTRFLNLPRILGRPLESTPRASEQCPSAGAQAIIGKAAQEPGQRI